MLLIYLNIYSVRYREKYRYSYNERVARYIHCMYINESRPALHNQFRSILNEWIKQIQVNMTRS